MTAATNQYSGQEVSLSYDRDGAIGTVLLTPRENPPENQGAIGIQITYPVISLPFGQIS